MSKEPLKYLALVVVIVIAAGGAYYMGLQKGLDETKNIVIENITNIDSPDETTADFGLFWEAWNKLKEEHINAGDIDDQSLIYGAINGLVKAFDDPNTVFFTPEDSKKFNDDIRGNFSGIGAEIGIRENILIVIAPLKGTPAETAGLLPGDQIIQIDGKSTDGIAVEEAVSAIRGELGTTVTLTILREGWENSRNFEITRANIRVPTVEWETLDGDIIHLRLFSFSSSAVLDFQKAMVSAIFSGGKGLVLDLRGNPGGVLDVAVRMAGYFVERGEIVATEKFTSGDDIVLRSAGNSALAKFPTVILIDGGSASASEILAGALRIHKGIKIIGTKSFGKGTVQEIDDLSDDSSIKITIANWLLPDGTLIEGNGLEPDITVEITEEDVAAGRDPQLEKAIEVLKERL